MSMKHLKELQDGFFLRDVANRTTQRETYAAGFQRATDLAERERRQAFWWGTFCGAAFILATILFLLLL